MHVGLLETRSSPLHDVSELPVSPQRSTEFPVPKLRLILFSIQGMYIIPHSLSLPCLHWKDTPVRTDNKAQLEYNRQEKEFRGQCTRAAHSPHTIYILIGTCRIPVGDTSGWFVFASEPAREMARIYSLLNKR